MLSEDIEHLQNLYLRTIFPSILALVVYSIFVLVIGAFDLVFALIVGCMLAIIVFLLPFVSLLLMKKHHVTFKRQKPFVSTTDGCCFGLSDWQASGRKGEFINEYVKQNDQLLKSKRE